MTPSEVCTTCGVPQHELIAGMKDLEPGMWVRHRGTRRWGEVLQVVPQHDRTLEIRIKREFHDSPFRYTGKPCGHCGAGAEEPCKETTPDEDTYWWASYHVDTVIAHKPTRIDRGRPRPWAPLGGLGL